MSEQDRFFAKYEKMGEEKVRKNLTLKHFRSSERPFAREWLRLRDQKRSKRRNTRAMIADIAAIVAAVAATISAIAWIVIWASS